MEVLGGIWQSIQTMDPAAAVCLVLGVVLIIIEMFTPGFAIPGISGLILLLIGIVLTAGSVTEGLIIFLVILAILTLVL